MNRQTLKVFTDAGFVALGPPENRTAEMARVSGPRVRTENIKSASNARQAIRLACRAYTPGVVRTKAEKKEFAELYQVVEVLDVTDAKNADWLHSMRGKPEKAGGLLSTVLDVEIL